jgi:hypothetical protein
MLVGGLLLQMLPRINHTLCTCVNVGSQPTWRLIWTSCRPAGLRRYKAHGEELACCTQALFTHSQTPNLESCAGAKQQCGQISCHIASEASSITFGQGLVLLSRTVQIPQRVRTTCAPPKQPPVISSKTNSDSSTGRCSRTRKLLWSCATPLAPYKFGLKEYTLVNLPACS